MNTKKVSFLGLSLFFMTAPLLATPWSKIIKTRAKQAHAIINTHGVPVSSAAHFINTFMRITHVGPVRLKSAATLAGAVTYCVTCLPKAYPKSDGWMAIEGAWSVAWKACLARFAGDFASGLGGEQIGYSLASNSRGLLKFKSREESAAQQTQPLKRLANAR